MTSIFLYTVLYPGMKILFYVLCQVWLCATLTEVFHVVFFLFGSLHANIFKFAATSFFRGHSDYRSWSSSSFTSHLICILKQHHQVTQESAMSTIWDNGTLMQNEYWTNFAFACFLLTVFNAHAPSGNRHSAVSSVSVVCVRCVEVATNWF